MATIVLTWSLWLTDRNFPLATIVHFPVTITDHGMIFLLLFLGTMVLLLFTDNRYIFLFFFLVLIFLVLQDINRFQTWLYVYVLVLLPIFLLRNKTEAIKIIHLVIIGLYLWSGIHKFNHSFIDETGIEIFTGIFRMSAAQAKQIGFIAYLVPCFQVLMATGLLFQKTRHVAIYMIVAMHLFICLVFIPVLHPDNYQIIPWNISMICIVLLAFYRYPGYIWNELKPSVVQIIFFLLVFILPTGYYMRIWPHNCSFHLYSSYNRYYYVAISEKYWPLVQKDCGKYLIELPEGTSGGVIIDMNLWSRAELGVVMFPEIYAYKKTSYFFCNKGIPSSDIQFMSFDHAITATELIKWSCQD